MLRRKPLTLGPKPKKDFVDAKQGSPEPSPRSLFLLHAEVGRAVCAPDFSREGNIVGARCCHRYSPGRASVEIWIELKGDEESKSSCFYTQLALKQREFERPWATYAGFFFFFFSVGNITSLPGRYISPWTVETTDAGESWRWRAKSN